MKAAPQPVRTEDLLPPPSGSIVVELVVVDVLGDLDDLDGLLDEALSPHGALRRYDTTAALRAGWRERRPDLLVVDGTAASGHELEAVELCAALSRAIPESSVPVVVMVDADHATARSAAFEAGAADVWIAPMGATELRTRLRNVTTANRSRVDLDWIDPGPPSPPRVLVADAHAPARKLLAHHLRAEGWEIVAVDDGRHAQQRLKTEAFDLVVLDLDLPHRNGFQILEMLRDDIGPSNARAVVLSSTSQDDHVLRAFRLGADDFVPKPFSPAVVHARLARCLARNRENTRPHTGCNAQPGR